MDINRTIVACSHTTPGYLPAARTLIMQPAPLCHPFIDRSGHEPNYRNSPGLGHWRRAGRDGGRGRAAQPAFIRSLVEDQTKNAQSPSLYVRIYLLSNKQDRQTRTVRADVSSSSLARFDASKPQGFDRKAGRLLGVIDYIHVERG